MVTKVPWQSSIFDASSTSQSQNLNSAASHKEIKMIVLKNKVHNFNSQTGQTSSQLLTEYIFFQIPPFILTHLLVFGEPKGSPNTSNILQNIRGYLAENCLIIAVASQNERQHIFWANAQFHLRKCSPEPMKSKENNTDRNVISQGDKFVSQSKCHAVVIF